MRLSYFILIHIYGFLINVASFFNQKAKQRLVGQQQVFTLLNEFLAKTSNAKYVWFHAASLGEFEQGRPVIEALKKLNPTYKIILTFFSPSGYELRKNYNGADLVCYLPLDTPKNAKKFISLVNPEKIIFIKYEFWPNFLKICKKQNIPVYVISATFRKSQLFFKWYGWAYANILKSFKKLYLQDEESRTLLKSINVTNVEVAGDTRFDRVFEVAQNTKPMPLISQFKNKQKLIVVGSSWPKDEELIFDYLKQQQDIKVIFAPHEINESHLSDIERKCPVSMLRFSKASLGELAAARCLLIDCIGLLSSIYKYADIAYVGGGFGVGIHNILEPAVYRIPVVFGPNYNKFNEAKDLITLGGGFSVFDNIDLRTTLDWLLLHGEAGEIAGDYVQQKIGATQKIIEGIFTEE